MKTGDLIQIGALAVIGFLAYQKYAAARGSSPISTSTPGLQPSQQRIVSTPDPNFGVADPNAGWDDDSGMTLLQKVIEWSP